LRLPEVQDNLSVRMLLLQRRLVERDAPVRIVKVARGRFRIEPLRPLMLFERPGPQFVNDPALTAPRFQQPFQRLKPGQDNGS
jgi:hypothetical protein